MPTFDPQRVEELRGVVRQRWQALLSGRAYADPLNVFVKREPHKIAKVRDGRFRLISAVSLEDAMVDRILFAKLHDDAMISLEQGLRVGWTWVHGGWREMYHRYAGKRVVCVDKSSWDWTMQGWIVECFIDFLNEIYADAPDWFMDLVRLRLAMLFRYPTFRFQDGSLVKQPRAGIMKSGCYITLILNSLAQMMLHCVASFRNDQDPDLSWPDCIGDDTVQETPLKLESYLKHLEDLGCTIKGAKVSSFIEFMGVQIDADRVVPSYWKKHLFKLSFHDRETLGPYLRDMQSYYHHSKSMQKIFATAAVALGLREYLVTRFESQRLIDDQPRNSWRQFLFED